MSSRHEVHATLNVTTFKSSTAAPERPRLNVFLRGIGKVAGLGERSIRHLWPDSIGTTFGTRFLDICFQLSPQAT